MALFSEQSLGKIKSNFGDRLMPTTNLKILQICGSFQLFVFAAKIHLENMKIVKTYSMWGSKTCKIEQNTCLLYLKILIKMDFNKYR